MTEGERKKVAPCPCGLCGREQLQNAMPKAGLPAHDSTVSYPCRIPQEGLKTKAGHMQKPLTLAFNASQIKISLQDSCGQCSHL